MVGVAWLYAARISRRRSELPSINPRTGRDPELIKINPVEPKNEEPERKTIQNSEEEDGWTECQRSVEKLGFVTASEPVQVVNESKFITVFYRTRIITPKTKYPKRNIFFCLRLDLSSASTSEAH